MDTNVKKFLTALLFILISTTCLAQPRGGSPSTKWIGLATEETGRPITIAVSTDVIEFNGNIMSLDVLGTTTAFDTYVPYVGSIKDVDLGAKNLTTTGIVNANGSIDMGNTAIVDADYIGFNVNGNPSYEEGVFFYDETHKCLSGYNDSSTFTHNYGREITVRVRNTTNDTIANGQLVYYSNTGTGHTADIKLAKADAFITQTTIGMATMDIPKNQFGEVTRIGEVHDVDTDGMTVGDILYLSPTTAGAYTTTRPSTEAGHFVAPIGRVVYADNNNGIIDLDMIHFPIADDLYGLTGITQDIATTGNITAHKYTSDLGAYNDLPFSAGGNEGFFFKSNAIEFVISGSRNMAIAANYVTFAGNGIKFESAADVARFARWNGSTHELFMEANVATDLIDFQGYDITTTGYSTNKNFTDSCHYTGYANRDDTTLGWADGSATFTLTVAGTATVWIEGTEYDISTLTSQLPSGLAAPSGTYWFWITAPGGVPQLNNSTAPANHFGLCLTASVYWNTTTNAGTLSDERHWFGRDKWMHEYLHETVGARYVEGLTGTFNDATFAVGAGEFYDEDIEHGTVEETVATVFYHDGVADWAFDTATSTPYKEVSSNLVYNNGTTLTQASANRFVNYYFFITPDTVDPVHIIIGTAQYTTLAGATDAALPSLGDLPGEEHKLIYQVTYKNTATITWAHTTDFRTAQFAGDDFVATDHSSLSNLIAPHDDHTQYWIEGATRTGDFTTTGHLGIGTTAVDASILRASETMTVDAFNAWQALLFQGTYDSSSGIVSGLVGASLIVGDEAEASSAGLGLIGAASQVNVSHTSGTHALAYGHQIGLTATAGGGTTTDAKALLINWSADGSETITTGTGIWLNDITNAGTAYGMVIDSDTVGLTLGAGQEATVIGSASGFDFGANAITTTGDISGNNVNVASGAKLNIEGSGGDTYFIYTGGRLELWVDNVLQEAWE